MKLNQLFIDEIQQILREDQYKFEEPMANHTTFCVGGPADLFIEPTIEQMPLVIKICSQYDIPMMVLGNGSNLLVGDKGIRGVVLSVAQNLEEIKIEEDLLYANAGAKLCDVAQIAAEHGLQGFEFASGIPGRIGGAVVMNAGAYGGEMQDVVADVMVATKEGDIRHLTKQELEFGYRHSSIIENNYVVLQATLKLTKGNAKDIKEQIADLTQKRQEKQPLEYASAGSTFKRPEGHFAGKLIMDSGLRGFSVGGAQVSEKHCGFIINKGNATAKDVCDLIDEVIRIVYDKQNVRLEPEVKRIGEF